MRISNIIAKWKNEYSSVWLNRFCMETLFWCLLIHHCSWFTLWVGRGAKNATFNMNLRFFRHQLVYPGRRERWFGQPLLGWVIYLNREILIYYIHTEKYSPKSYIVNFRTQISSSQSEEQTMVFTREKNDTSSQNREWCLFHVWEKWYVQSEATEVCEFRAKIPAFYCSLRRRFAHIQRGKFYSKSFSR